MSERLQAPARWPAIDALRGCIVALMILVNEWAGVAGLPAWLQHVAADVDGMSVADMVFPGFLFIVGLSLPLALRERGPDLGTLRQVGQRSLGLLVLGLWMVNADMAPAGWPAPAWLLGGLLAAFAVWGSLRGGPPLAWPWRLLGLLGLVALLPLYPGDAQGRSLLGLHWWGILGLIGWAYALASLLYLFSPPRWRLAMALAALPLCVLWRTLGLEGGAHATHSLLVLSGVASTLLLQRQEGRGLLGLLAALLLAGLVLRPGLGLSKIQATPAWGLLCAAGTLVLFLLLEQALRRAPQGCARLFAPLQDAGRHPLLAYLLPYVLGAGLGLLGWQWPPAWGEGVLGLLRGLLMLGAMLGLLRLLTRAGVGLRL